MCIGSCLVAVGRRGNAALEGVDLLEKLLPELIILIVRRPFRRHATVAHGLMALDGRDRERAGAEQAEPEQAAEMSG